MGLLSIKISTVIFFFVLMHCRVQISTSLRLQSVRSPLPQTITQFSVGICQVAFSHRGTAGAFSVATFNDSSVRLAKQITPSKNETNYA
jgi:hypothetical protein